MSDAPLISVIIPTYNCEGYIAQTLDSVLHQRRVPTPQIIVVDDGSSDRTCDVVARYGEHVQLHRKENAGVSAARNLGFSMASASRVCFMDHDDWWHPDKLHHQLQAFERHPQSAIVFTSFLRWIVQDESFPTPEQRLAEVGVSSQAASDDLDMQYSGWIYPQLLQDCWVLTSSAMIDAAAFRAAGGFREDLPYSEDWDLWLRLSRTYPFQQLAFPFVLYRQLPTQGSRKVRDRDFRTELLLNAYKTWGLSGPDGTSLEPALFFRQVSRYHGSYGLGHLRAGNKQTALKALLRGWWMFPGNIKLLAYAAAGAVGWRPSW